MPQLFDSLGIHPALIGNLITASVIGAKWLFDDFVEPLLIEWRIRAHENKARQQPSDPLTSIQQAEANLKADSDKRKWRKGIVPVFTGTSFLAALLLLWAGS